MNALSNGGNGHGTRFRMPFGAEAGADGTRFRLWAPAQRHIDLLLPDRGLELPMRRLDAGWFELTVADTTSGSRYWFRLEDGAQVPDPAARAQETDVHGPSVVVDPHSYRWRQTSAPIRHWNECVIYELHVGAFSETGTFDGVRARLDHLVELGITAVELMPVADFPGARNWGYDGVLPFAPDRRYGSPDALKALVDAAHERGLAVVLDVVYNHFGPDGNYLHLYAPQFFDERIETPWGAGIAFTQPVVREFFIHNALYWLSEYRIDGLRLDAVHAIHDLSETHILDELAARVRREHGDRVWLVLENDDNAAHFLSGCRAQASGSGGFNAQWNDDLHHVAHVLLTGETHGYYADYESDAQNLLGRALTQGFVYQGERSPFRDGARRGAPSVHLPPGAFVDFLQNHDQIGNRAMGERLTVLADEQAVRCLLAVLLLSPQPPLLFMGEEWGSRLPFLYFCDHDQELAAAVREGRRKEFAKFPEFADSKARELIPDPNAEPTFTRSCLDWHTLETTMGRERFEFVQTLLRVRREHIMATNLTCDTAEAQFRRWGQTALHVTWKRNDTMLHLLANLAIHSAEGRPESGGRVLFEWPPGAASAGTMPAWSVTWFLKTGSDPS
ncbi:malto-oligosyltrehalose trehalohydrolase [soil metagenome]